MSIARVAAKLAITLMVIVAIAFLMALIWGEPKEPWQIITLIVIGGLLSQLMDWLIKK